MEYSIVGSIIIWGIAFLWFGGVLGYLQQSIDMQIKQCAIDPADSGSLRVRIDGLVKSRHKDCLSGLQLNMGGDTFSPLAFDSKLPSALEKHWQKFNVIYKVPRDLLEFHNEHGGIRGGQNVGQAIIGVNLPSSNWFTTPIKIPLGDWERETNIKVKKQTGVTKKQFPGILDKASQAVKKSEKGKS